MKTKNAFFHFQFLRYGDFVFFLPLKVDYNLDLDLHLLTQSNPNAALVGLIIYDLEGGWWVGWNDWAR